MKCFRAGLGILCALALVTPTWGQIQSQTDHTAIIGNLDPHALHLRAGTIPLDAATSMHRPNSGAVVVADSHFVIQLDGPLTPQRVTALQAAGVTLGNYLPAYAYIVRLPAGYDPVARLGGLSFVRWLGEFENGWKLDPEIGLHTYQTAERQALAQQQRVRLTVQLFVGEDLDAAAAALVVRPGIVLRDVTQAGEYGMIELEMPLADYPQLASLASVQWVEDASELVHRNSTNSWILQSNVTGVTPVWSHGITGVGQVGGHIDGGVNSSHCFFRDPGGAAIGPTHRKIVYYGGTAAYNQHGTHTAGTFVGDPQPIDGTTTNRGLAYNARMAHTRDSTLTSSNLLTILTQNASPPNGAPGGRVHTNSWGNDSTTAYIAWTQAVDQFSFNNEDNLVCFAVTNLNAAVKTPENAKNCLAVAASQDTPNQGSFCSGGTWFTVDGRRKPEVMAPGCSTVSASGSGTVCTTASLTGTSMACPAVSGAGLLVREYFMDGFYPSGAAVGGDAFTPSGALIKAVLINSAVDMTGIAGYPSNQEGYGRVLLDNSLYFAGDARKLIIYDVRNASGMTTGQSRSYNFNVLSNSQPLEITLVWTEKEAALNANPAYINNLNLVVTAPGPTNYLGNVFAGGESTTGGAADTVNNTEVFLRTSPAVGSYTVNVNATAVNTATAQGFALVITGDVSSMLPAPTLGSITPNSGETDTVVGITNLAGSNFQNGATVKLTRVAQPDIVATGVNVVNANQITCNLDLTGAVVGAWDVVVTNPDTQTATLPAAFTVTVTCTPGDMNNDGLVNGDDVQLFTNVMLTGSGTQRQLCAADLNSDSTRDSVDIDRMVDCLLGINCP